MLAFSESRGHKNSSPPESVPDIPAGANVSKPSVAESLSDEESLKFLIENFAPEELLAGAIAPRLKSTSIVSVDAVRTTLKLEQL